MTFLVLSFVAGFLTVLTPCVLPLVPVVLGRSAVSYRRSTTYVVIIALAASLFLSTLLLKVSTSLIAVPPFFWSALSGGLLILVGIGFVFPSFWSYIPGWNRLSQQSNAWLGTGYQKQSIAGDVVVGAALGPVFASCSPTYFLILATVLPESLTTGLLYLLLYIMGLTLTLLVLALFGQHLIKRLLPHLAPTGWFMRSVGVLFIIVGLSILTGLDKVVEAELFSLGFDATRLEQRFIYLIP